MDRKLLIGAVILLIIEIVFFLGDLGVVRLPFWTASHHIEEQPAIGEVAFTKQNVRRRANNSLVWEDSGQNDILRSYDSVLTLSESSAQLKLQGDIQVELHENTLVVLEPMQEQQNDSFKLRFHHGDMRSQLGTQRMRLGSGEWTLDAQPGADLSLRSRENGEVEVEVESGDVQIRHQNQGVSQKIHAQQRLQLGQNQISNLETFSPNLKWRYDENQRVYGHRFPVPFTLKWQGEATKLVHLRPEHPDRAHVVSLSQRALTIELEPGSHAFRLYLDEKTSPSLNVNVWQAPVIVYRSPLPRDRVHTQRPVEFVWSAPGESFTYRLEFAREPTFYRVFKDVISADNATEHALAEEGPLFWRVIGTDERGFDVPAFYTYPLFSVPEPLAAPVLRAPARQRQPATKESPPDQGRVWWHWLIPTAQAEEAPDRFLIFNWYPVPDADYYVVEVSLDSDFRDPVLIQKVRSTQFEWKILESAKSIYFRVAGGKDNGRMGLFSAPQFINLRQSPDANGEIAPGVQLAEKPKPAPPPKPAPRKIVRQPKPVVKQPPPPKPQPKPTPQPPVATIPKAPPTPPYHERHSYIRFWWLGSYALNHQQASQDIEARNRGGHPLGLGLQANIASPTSLGSWMIEAEAQAQQWNNKDSSAWTQQSDLEKLSWGFSLARRSGHGSLGQWGLSATSVPWAKRDGSESMELEDLVLFGGFVGLLWRPVHALESDARFEILTGPELHAFGVRQKFSWHWRAIWWGFGYRAHYLSDFSDRNGYRIQADALFGFEW